MKYRSPHPYLSSLTYPNVLLPTYSRESRHRYNVRSSSLRLVFTWQNGSANSINFSHGVRYGLLPLSFVLTATMSVCFLWCLSSITGRLLFIFFPGPFFFTSPVYDKRKPDSNIGLARYWYRLHISISAIHYKNEQQKAETCYKVLTLVCAWVLFISFPFSIGRLKID